MPSLEWTVINWCIWDTEVYGIAVSNKFSTHEFMAHVPCSEYSRKFFGSMWNKPFLMASSWTIWTWTFPNHIRAVIWVEPLSDMIPPSSLPLLCHSKGHFTNFSATVFSKTLSPIWGTCLRPTPQSVQTITSWFWSPDFHVVFTVDLLSVSGFSCFISMLGLLHLAFLFCYDTCVLSQTWSLDHPWVLLQYKDNCINRWKETKKAFGNA